MFAIRIQPIIPVFDITGGPKGLGGTNTSDLNGFAGSRGSNLGNAPNPLARQWRERDNPIKATHIFGNVFTELEIIKDLKILAAQKLIIETEPGKYLVKATSQKYYEGKIDMTSRKTGYFVSDELENDVFVPFVNLNHALDGDTVKAYVYDRRSSRKPEAEVLEILERAKEEFVGVIDIQKNFGFVTTANAKMYTDIFIPKNKLADAEHGDVVLVKMEDWPAKADSPFGSVIKVLGKPGEHNTEIHAILAEYGLPYDFPIEVEAYANKIDTSITADEIAKRRDMRDVLTFTIDPKDAKDFDDALSFQVLENGNFEIGVHIADVSHYLKEGTILDDEAYKRATSVYLVDRVVPMLPEVLSNFACSLRPHEEKYTFSAVFELNPKAEVVNQWFGRTVIYSDQRFAYEEAQSIIETLATENQNVKGIRFMRNFGKTNNLTSILMRQSYWFMPTCCLPAIQGV